MPARHRRPAARFAVAPAVILCAAVALAQPPDPPARPADPPTKAPAPKEAKDKEPPKAPQVPPPTGIKLPDGTFLWTGPGTTGGDGERVILTPEELQKLLDQVEQLKKQLAARKPIAPSGCAIRGKVEKRGESVVAALKVTYTFRTTAPNTAVSLGCRRAFLASATLDGNKLPVLDSGDDGLAALVETPGDHTLTVELEAPVTGRGTKTEIGFELGLPRAAITSLLLDLPPDVKRVTLSTRTPDPTQPLKPAEVRRVPALDVKELAARPGQESGYLLGPVDQVEVTWEPAAAPPADVGQSADVEVVTVLTEGLVETTAKFRLRGSSREWRIVSPAEPVPERAGGSDLLPLLPPSVGKPTDPAKRVWKVTLPVGVAPADWVFTAVVRQERPKTGDAKHKGPFAVGPFSVPGITRQTGSVRITAAANTRLTFAHGPDLRRAEPTAPAEDDVTAAFFRLAPGPTTPAPQSEPLLRVTAEPMKGTVRIRPTYKLRLTEGGWQVRAELQVTPIRRDVEAIAIEVPASWPRAILAEPAKLVEGVHQDDLNPDAQWRTVTVRLAAAQKLPFDLVLTTTLGVPPLARDATIPLIRFPDGVEAETGITATVPPGLEVRGAAREWEANQSAGWAQPLAPVPGPDGKPPKAATAVQGKFDLGLARVDLSWQPYRPELTADVRAELTVTEQQVLVTQQVKLRSPDGFPKSVRFRGPPGLTGASLEPVGAGEWSFTPPADAREVTVPLTYAVALPRSPGRGPWKVAVGLLWPGGATRTETVVRVWTSAGSGRVVTVEPGPWRELPPEPVPDRDSLPTVTLAGSGVDLPLTLESREAAEPTGVAVWADRGLIQVWTADDGTIACRARFLLKRWLSNTIELRLPGPAFGPAAPEVFLDDPPRKVDAVFGPDPAGGPDRLVQVNLPASRPGRTIVLEVRYQLAAGRPGDGSLYPAPRPKAAFTGPVRWQIAILPGTTPLVFGDGLTTEQRWRFRSGMFVPGPATTTDELERWFRSGTEPDGNGGADPWQGGTGDPLVLRQTGHGPARVYRVPTVGLIVAASAVVLLIGLVVSRLRGAIAGPLVAVLAGGAAVGAVLFPQPASQVAAAAEPGLAVLVLVLVLQAAGRWYYRKRVTYLPGFTRTRPEPQLPPSAPSSAQASRPLNGSTGSGSPSAREPHPAAPSGS
jgi:hypothetical protein